MELKHFALIIVSILLIGCNDSDHNENANTQVIAEGIIWHVEYELGEGKSTGFTRAMHAEALPSGGGSLKVDAYGRLTSQFLIITYPNMKELKEHIIPVNRLLSIQFGDGGVKTTGQQIK
jgi:hypothetical protein